MSAKPKFDRTLKRREARQKKFRQRYLQLMYGEYRCTSGQAVRQVAIDFNLTEDRCFAVIRPVDVRVMLENDWEGTMKLHGLDLPRPIGDPGNEIERLDELEAVV